MEWEIYPFQTGGTTYYMGAASAKELDAVCRVPSYAHSSRHAELGAKVLNQPDDDQEWQRPLELDRRDDIMRFSGEPTAGIANSITLYLPSDDENSHVKSDSVRIERGSGKMHRLVIDMLGFLKVDYEDDDEIHYTDVDMDTDTDLRPLVIIDGQHRVRGVSASAYGQDMMIPFVLMPPDEEIMGAARRFSEMNTGQEKLKESHDLFVRYWFGLGSDNIKSVEKDFRDLDPSHQFYERSRANRMAYKAAAKLTSDSESELFDRIQMLPNFTQPEVTEGPAFVKHARNWFIGNGPFGPGSGKDFDEAYEEIKAYFSALARVSNHDVRGVGNWKDGKERWISVPGDVVGRPVNMHKGPFNSIIWLFPTAYDKFLEHREEDTSLSIEDAFCKALMPLAWVDWRDSRLKRYYQKETGDAPQKSLYSWLSWAVENGTRYRKTEVMSTDSSLCLPGKGILAPPNKQSVTIDSGSGRIFWPAPRRPLKLYSPLPPNTFHRCEWLIRADNRGDPGELEFKARKDAGSTGRGFSTLTLKHQGWMDDADVIEVEVVWTNMPGLKKNSHGTHKITITRGGSQDPGGSGTEPGRHGGPDGDDPPTSAPTPTDGDGGGGPGSSTATISHGTEREVVVGLESPDPEAYAVFRHKGATLLPPRPPRRERMAQGEHAPLTYRGGYCSMGFHGICDKHSCKWCNR